MKSKSTTYILIFGVLLVWGLVFYRIFSGMDSENDSAFMIPKKKPIQTIEAKEEGVLVLIGNYRDPFLGGTSSAIVSGGYTDGIPKSNSGAKSQKQKKEIDWSFIDYIGIVQNKETKKKVGLVNISGKEYMVNEKDVINEVTILKRERDSILVRYEGVKKWVRR